MGRKRKLFPEVVTFLKSYIVDVRNKYAVTYDDRSLYREEDSVPEPIPIKPRVLKHEYAAKIRPSQDARLSLVSPADSGIYLLQNEVTELKLENSKLENELQYHLRNYKQLEDAYKKQSQLCLDLSKQIETLKTERDFKHSATLKYRSGNERQ